MSIENGSVSSSAAVRLPQATLNQHDGRRRSSGPVLTGCPSAAGMSSPPQPGADHAFHSRTAGLRAAEDPLPFNDFLLQLQREKRRAERSKAALSIVLYRIDVTRDDADVHASRLVEVLYRVKRETDILGYVGGDLVAVLFPDTGKQGAEAFVQKVQAHPDAAGLPFVPVSATYPDAAFDAFVDGHGGAPEVLSLLFADHPRAPRVGYPLKRVLDLTGALVALVLLSPLMLGVAIAVALTSPGNVIFRQVRLGKGGEPFVFYKFRSMRTDADDGIHREFVANLIRGEPEQASGSKAPRTMYKLTSDPRVTRIGKFIRRTSIDELPQLFNVLKGDMSLAGPRPPIPYEAASYQAWHLRRILSVRPGITGLWQVEGRSRVSFDEMVRMDLRYIRRCSLGLDLRILLKTVLVVLRCEGAT